MPLAAEYTWAESESFVQLQVPLRGRAKSTVDVFATECYVKISFPPYLLELDIDGCIDSAQHKARVEKGILVVKLKKKSDSFGIWGSLGQRVDRKCDPKVTARREQSIKEKLKWEEELKERISLRKHHDERLSLRSQMGVDEAERRLIDDIKAEEKEKAEAEEWEAAMRKEHNSLDEQEAEVYRTFADLAAKQSRRHSPTAELLLPAPVEQPKQASSGGEKQHALLSPPLASTTVSERRSSGGPLGTIPEEVSEEVSTDGGNSPTPAVSTSVVVERTLGGPLRTIPEEYSGDEGSPLPMASTAAAAKVADRSIWKETIGSDEHAEADEHRFEGPEGGGSDANKVALNPPAQDAGQDEIRENTLASDDDGVVAYVPAPRVPAGVIPIGFSTRLFPTPLRESKVADESAWIMKNRRHLHKNKTLVGRLPSEGEQEKDRDLNFDISESDPVWLKGKGDDLYRGGDFLGAINAYTAALEADPKAAACLSNRAACHLRLDQISACVADCGAALEIFRTLPETGPNQARVLVRRSLAYRELGHYKLSLNDCRAALGFNPGDTVLQRETARAEPLALCEAAKKEAVAHFASGDIAGACELYTAALAAVPAFPSCLSNRAVCYLALGKPQDCVRDCTAVLDMLSAGPSAAGLRANARRSDPPPKDPATAGRGRALVPPPGSMPPPGSVKRRRWVLTTMLRRARANVQLGCLESALQDYRAASSLAPGDKAIEGDVRELERQLNSDAERRPLTH